MHQFHSSPKQRSFSSLRLLALILLVFCPWLIAALDRIELPVGKLFLLPTNGRHVDPAQFPKWCRFNQTDGQIYGIPQLKDLGIHVISIEDKRVEVNVFEEVQNSCGETETLWVDVLDGRKLSEVPIPEQLNALKSLMALLKDIPKIGLEDWRILSFNYAYDRYRKIGTTLSDSVARDRLGPDNKPLQNQMILTMNLSCGELNDFAMDVVNVFAEKQSFMVVEGFLNVKRVPIVRVDESMVPAKIPMKPVNIEKSDQPVVTTTKMSTFVCKKGSLCRVKIGEDTFMESTNTPTSHLTLAAHPVSGIQKNFLVHIPGTDILEGVPLDAETGDTINYKLEARDKSGRTATIPIQIYLGQTPAKNHEYVMLLDTPAEQFRNDPKTLRKLVILLMASIKNMEVNPDQLVTDSLASNTLNEIRINDVKENGPVKSIVKWSNLTMLANSWPCETSPPSDLKSKACYASPPQLVILSNTSLDSAFHFEQITFQQEPVEWTASSFANSPLNLVKQEPVEEEKTSRSWVPILIALILILLILAVLAFYLIKRQLAQKSKTRTQKNGMNGGSMSTVTTPMLVDAEKAEQKVTVTKATTSTTIVQDLSSHNVASELLKTPEIDTLPLIIDETANEGKS